MTSHRSDRLFLSLLVAVVSSLLLASLSIAIMNLVVVPRALGRIETALEGRCGCPVEIGRARYLPIRGVTLRDISVGGGTGEPVLRSGGRVAPADTAGIEVTIERMRSAIAPGMIAAIRRNSSLTLPRFDPRDPARAIRDLADAALAARLVPRFASIDGISVTLPRAPRVRLDSLSFESDRGGGEITLSGYRESGPAMIFEAGYAPAGPELDAIVTLRGLEFAAFLPIIRHGVVGIRLTVSSDRTNRITLSGELEIADLELVLPAVAHEPIGPFDITYRFDGNYEWSGSGRFALSRGDLTMNGVEASVRLELEGPFAEGGELPLPETFRLAVELPLTGTQQLLASIPGALSGPIRFAELEGRFGFDLEVEVPVGAVSEMSWGIETELEGFAVRGIDRTIDVYRLNDAFTHVLIDDEGRLRALAIPPERPASMEWMVMHSEHTARQIEAKRAELDRITRSRPPVRVTGAAGAPVGESDGSPTDDSYATDPEYRYVRLDDISPWIVRAVLTAEDGDFFFYGGVNPVTLADAIEINLREGGIVVGASTISMQLVKMLFLDQERIFARKLQEVFLVYLMEHQVPVSKDRILELYLNTVELGPGIYGVAHAASHYFGKSPAELSAGEATWLASILPSPRLYHRYFEEGAIPDLWLAKMAGLYEIMLARGRMTAEEYREAIAEPPGFRTRAGE